MKRGTLWSWLFPLLAVLGGGIAFAVVLDQVYLHGLEQTSVLFVTIPLLLGVVAAILPLELHAVWKALILVTLCLIESFVFFGEGVICVLMAAPLFYGFAILGALIVHIARKRSQGQRAFILVGLPLFSLVLGPREPAPMASAEASIFLANVDVEEVEARLAAPRDMAMVPWSLSLFPIPVESRGSGIEVGDTRSVYFAGGEGQPGWFELAVTERAPDRIVTTLVRDDSHIAHWLAWNREEIRWQAEEGGTRVTWRVHYQNELSPNWYFGPAEKVAMTLAAEHLVTTCTAPVL